MKIHCPKTNKKCTGWKCPEHKTCTLIHKLHLQYYNLKEVTASTPDITITASSHTNTDSITTLTQDLHDSINAYNDLSEKMKILKEGQRTIHDHITSITTPLKIKKISTPTINVTLFTQQRFKSWSNEEETISSIPPTILPLALTLDHKKVKALIEDGKLPKSILNQSNLTDPITAIKITKRKV